LELVDQRRVRSRISSRPGGGLQGPRHRHELLPGHVLQVGRHESPRHRRNRLPPNARFRNPTRASQQKFGWHFSYRTEGPHLPPMSRILIVDDQDLFRDALVGLVTDRIGAEVVGVASSIQEAKRKIVSLAPEVALVDLLLEDGTATE